MKSILKLAAKALNAVRGCGMLEPFNVPSLAWLLRRVALSRCLAMAIGPMVQVSFILDESLPFPTVDFTARPVFLRDAIVASVMLWSKSQFYFHDNLRFRSL